MNLLIKLRWPPAPKDRQEALKHRKQLKAARRCLAASAPITLAETGFQLILEDELPVVHECIRGILEGITTPEESLTILEAPDPALPYAAKLFHATQVLTMQEFIEDLEEVIDKVLIGKDNARTFNQAYYKVEALSLWTPSEDLSKVHQFLKAIELIETEDEEARSDKADRLRSLQRFVKVKLCAF